MIRVLCLLLPLATGGCVSRGGGVEFSDDPLGTLHRGVVRAATDPHTWVPLVAAGVIYAAGVDDDISDWAREHKPLTEISGPGDTFSDVLVAVAGVGSAAVSGLPIEPGFGGGDPWLRHQRMLTTGLSIGLASSSVHGLKRLFARPRPLHGVKTAFPSGHMTLAGAAAANWRRNIDYLPISPSRKGLLKGGFVAMTAIAGWDRIEKGRHFPTDILAGYAYGNFIGSLLHEGTLGGWQPPRFYLGASPSRDGAAFRLGVTGEL